MKQDLIKLVVQPADKPKAKPHHLEYYLRNEDGTKGYGSEWFTVENRPTVEKLNTIFKGITPNPAPSSPATFVHGTDYYASDPTYYEPMDGNGPTVSGDLTLELPSMKYKGVKVEGGIKLIENGYDGGFIFNQYSSASLTSDYSNTPEISAPSIMANLYFKSGDDSKPDVSVNVEGQYLIFKISLSINANGEEKMSFGFKLPSSKKISGSASVDVKIAESEKRIKF